MKPRLHLFVDFDDTLSDFRALGKQYVYRLSQILSAEFGGAPEKWLAAIQPALAATVQRYVDRFARDPLADYNAWIEAERARVATEVFERAGRERPDEDAARELARLLQERALRGCNALFAGADSALENLQSAGYPICVASSQESAYLRAALTGSPAILAIERFYGPDLIDCAKETPEFYRRVFNDRGIAPEQAVVIDDQVTCLEWAAETGAGVVQARLREDPEPIGADFYFEKWEELPAIIETLASAGNLTDDADMKE